MNRPVWAEIDLEAIRSNTSLLKSRLNPGSILCAVVKADGYGHGAVETAQATLAGGAEFLAVAITSEAVQLRKAGINVPILILGYTPPEQAELIANYDIDQSIFTMEQAQALSHAGKRLGKTIHAHIKIDTGMTRLGLTPENAGEFAASASTLPGLELRGVFTHFSDADSTNRGYTERQLRLYRQALADISSRGVSIRIRHAANTAALLQYPDAQFDMVRAGIALYGLYPSAILKNSIALKPAMSLKSRIAMLKHVPEGTAIGYGCKHITSGGARIATLPFGYADGYPRRLGGVAEMTVGGARTPVVGNICMDQCMIDVTAATSLDESDEVLVFGGDGVSVDEVAAWLGTINYEVVSTVGKRVRREYLPFRTAT